MSFGPFQVLYCDIECHIPVGNILRVVCIYRPPNSDVDSTLLMLNSLENDTVPLRSNIPTVIMGDFNLTKLNWDVPCTNLNCTRANTGLLHMAQRTHLIQVVTESTHNDNITDLLFISSSDLVSNVCTGLPLSTSDHNSIECELEFISSSDFNSSLAVSEGHLNQLDFNQIDYAGLAASLSITDRQTVFSVNASIDEAWIAFHLYITSLIELKGI